MTKIKQGKEEIVYLLKQVVEKYKTETGVEIVQNTNRKNYEGLAILLSDITKDFPERLQELGTDSYSPDTNPNAKEFPYRKYDITGGQIKDALNGIVSHPRPYLVDACYIYLFGIGRKRFASNPTDPNLLETSGQEKNDDVFIIEEENIELKKQLSQVKKQYSKKTSGLKTLSVVIFLILCGILINYNQSNNKWNVLKRDMNILPYQPTPMEIDSLEGIWLCYTGSPQARISDPKRFHKVVSNIVSIKYKDGYFTFNRYGASFDHVGYMQFESPGIVSIYSRVKNKENTTESPRHSLLDLNYNNTNLTAISTSWNFDIGKKNKIIGIREVYTKLGKGGDIEEVINDIENASCGCKIIKWHKPDNIVHSFYLKNEILDSISSPDLKSLIDEKSILLGRPQEGVVLTKDTTINF